MTDEHSTGISPTGGSNVVKEIYKIRKYICNMGA
jgi:hypothetical protein